MAGNTSETGRSVLSRALAVLAVFSAERPVQTLASITRSTGLAPATAYRLVGELVEWGALERVERGRYRIGMRLWQVGALAPTARGLRDTALPYLQDLCTTTGHYVHLVVIDGHQALYVERLIGRVETAVRSRVGMRLPLHATGPGKVLLAYASPDFVAEVIEQGLPRLASATITDPGELLSALVDIRTAGYAVTKDQITQGTASVAAPILSSSGTAIAALSVVFPSDTATTRNLVPAVRIASAAVSRALGAI